MFAKVTEEQSKYEETIKRMEAQRLEVHVANQTMMEAQKRYKGMIGGSGDSGSKIKDIIGKCIEIDGKPVYEVLSDSDTKDASPAESPAAQ